MYNSVKVELANAEFNSISTKEMQVAKYLDLLHSVKLPKEGEEELISFEQIYQLSNVDHTIESVRNKQSQPTSLLGDTRDMLRITQAWKSTND